MNYLREKENERDEMNERKQMTGRSTDDKCEKKGNL